MKKLFAFSINLLLAIMVFTGCNSSDKPKDLIAKKWTVTTATTKDGTDRTEDLKGTVIDFGKDGKVIVKGKDLDETGTYTVSEDGKTFMINQSNGKKANNDILTLTKDKFSFKDIEGGMTISMESK